MKVQLSADEDRRIAEKPIDDAKAFDCYLRARHEYSRGNREGVEAALRYIDEGLEMVGPNALLYASKGYAYFNLAWIDTYRHRDYLKNSREWAEKSFELEPDSARGRGLLGLVLWDLFETVEGIRHVERAYELDPNDIDNLTWLTFLYGTLGKAECLKFYPLLLERDGLNPFNLFVGAMCHVWTDRLGEAESLSRRCFEMSGGSPHGRTAYGQVLASRGKMEQALDVLAPFESTPETHTWVTLGLLLKYALEGNKAKVDALVTEELEEAFRIDQIYALLLAERYALLEANARALEWLEIAVEGGIWNPEFLRSDPLLRSIQDEPDLARLVDLAREKRRPPDP